jgi:hypothetical protein
MKGDEIQVRLIDPDKRPVGSNAVIRGRLFSDTGLAVENRNIATQHTAPASGGSA